MRATPGSAIAQVISEMVEGRPFNGNDKNAWTPDDLFRMLFFDPKRLPPEFVPSIPWRPTATFDPNMPNLPIPDQTGSAPTAAMPHPLDSLANAMANGQIPATDTGVMQGLDQFIGQQLMYPQIPGHVYQDPGPDYGGMTVLPGSSQGFWYPGTSYNEDDWQ